MRNSGFDPSNVAVSLVGVLPIPAALLAFWIRRFAALLDSGMLY